MNIETVIEALAKDINYLDKDVKKLRARQDTLIELSKQYPDMICVNNVFCLPDIWKVVSCMRLDRIRHGYSYSSMHMVARFSVGAKNLIGGMKMHTAPYNNVIAKIDYPYRGNKTIEIYNYDAMIPSDCPHRAKFIRRIKARIIQQITRGLLTITDNSYDKFGIEKLMLLR